MKASRKSQTSRCYLFWHFSPAFFLDLSSMCRRLDNSATLHMITRLAESGILHLTYSDEANNPFPLVGTHLNTYEILQAFQGTDHSKLANKHVTVVMGF